MGAEESGSMGEPLVQPRIIRLLKDRPKLVMGDRREQFLEQLENSVAQRRVPDVVADRAAGQGFDRAKEAAQPVVRETMRDSMERLNERLLKNL